MKVPISEYILTIDQTNRFRETQRYGVTNKNLAIYDTILKSCFIRYFYMHDNTQTFNIESALRVVGKNRTSERLQN